MVSEWGGSRDSESCETYDETAAGTITERIDWAAFPKVLSRFLVVCNRGAWNTLICKAPTPSLTSFCSLVLERGNWALKGVLACDKTGRIVKVLLANIRHKEYLRLCNRLVDVLIREATALYFISHCAAKGQ